MEGVRGYIKAVLRDVDELAAYALERLGTGEYSDNGDLQNKGAYQDNKDHQDNSVR